MHIHLIGVGGAAMGNLAAMLKADGNRVTGSDAELYPPMSDRLKEWKIETLPFDKKNIEKPDLIIPGNVLSRGNPEIEAMLNLNKNYMSMPEALKNFFLKKNQVIVAAGTHGKTTTTFLTDHLLSSGAKKPGLFAGGVRGDGHPGWRIGNSGVFVIEGDEYDTAFFDKHSKFLHYRPYHLILTSVEFDHADIFSDMEHYLLSFKRLLRTVPSNGSVIASADSSHVRSLLKGYRHSRVQYYSAKRKKIDGLTAASFQKASSGFMKIDFDGFGLCSSFPMIGDHNAMNALAALSAAGSYEKSKTALLKRMESFPGVLRRQQKRAETEGSEGGGPSVLIEDFAHHPTAVRETIAAVKKAYPGRKIYALFEPRSATSHRKIFQDEYSQSLKEADEIYICDIFNPGKVNAKERLNVKKVADAVNAAKKRNAAHACRSPSDILDQLRKSYRPAKKGTVLLAMSNGAFGGIYGELEKMVSSG